MYILCLVTQQPTNGNGIISHVILVAHEDIDDTGSDDVSNGELSNSEHSQNIFSSTGSEEDGEQNPDLGMLHFIT